MVRNGRKRAKTHQSLHPGNDIAHPTFQRGREPALWSSAIEKPWFAVSGIALPSPPTYAPSTIKGLFDLSPPMHDLRGEDHLARCIIDQRQASRLPARIKLDPKWSKVRTLHLRLQNEHASLSPHTSSLPLF